MSDAIKFPKTPRLTEVSGQDVYLEWGNHTAVVEEKVDGANVGIWFDGEEMQLQSRGHVLRGGAWEAQFAPMHGWAWSRFAKLQSTLGEKYVLYGEWCYAKNKSFYDNLPDYFLAFDVFDRESGYFLPTYRKEEIFFACQVLAVPWMWKGPFRKVGAFASHIRKSHFKTPKWRDHLLDVAREAGVTDPMSTTDNSDYMEGVYIRIEDDTRVVGRMKLHREGYEKVRNDNWRRQPLIVNRLAV